MHRYYEFLDDQINDLLGVTVGFENLIATDAFLVQEEALAAFFNRFNTLKSFQQTTLELFKASLKGDFDPELAALIINETPTQMGYGYHARLTARQHQTPLFFRTDEVVPGKIVEIQCPGSAWGLYEQLYLFYQQQCSQFDFPKTFPISLAEGFSRAVHNVLGAEPRIHHLLDNASIPHGMRFFIQKTRRYGLKYFGFDKGVTPYDCNLIRSHDFVSLFNNNFAQQRLIDCENQRLVYDLPPSALYEQKIIFTFPFWSKTRAYYSDEIRNLFPFTQLIRPEGVTLEDGTTISLDDFSRLSQKQRCYFVKYAGCDISLNWGSKGVFYMGSLSQIKAKALLDRIVDGYSKSKYWLLQKSHLHTRTVNFLTRDGEEKRARVYSKHSGFYGPQGLMGLLSMARPFNKVHGTKDTIVSIHW